MRVLSSGDIVRTLFAVRFFLLHSYLFLSHSYSEFTHFQCYLHRLSHANADFRRARLIRTDLHFIDDSFQIKRALFRNSHVFSSSGEGRESEKGGRKMCIKIHTTPERVYFEEAKLLRRSCVLNGS